MDSILILEDSSTSQRERSMPGIHHIQSSRKLTFLYRNLLLNWLFLKYSVTGINWLNASPSYGDCMLFIPILLRIFTCHSRLVLPSITITDLQSKCWNYFNDTKTVSSHSFVSPHFQRKRWNRPKNGWLEWRWLSYLSVWILLPFFNKYQLFDFCL